MGDNIVYYDTTLFCHVISFLNYVNTSFVNADVSQYYFTRLLVLHVAQNPITN